MPPPELRAEGAPSGEWRPRLEKIDSLLRSQKWKKASREGKKLVSELAAAGGGDRSGELVGRAAAYLALAELGLGEEEAAACHWLAAQAVYRGVEKLPLEIYGLPVEFFRSHRRRRLGERPKGLGFAAPGQVRRTVTPPTAKDDLLPPPVNLPPGSFPPLMIEAVVDPAGRITHPAIIQAAPNPGATWVVLEGLCVWRMEPARMGDEPVAVLHRFEFPLVTDGL